MKGGFTPARFGSFVELALFRHLAEALTCDRTALNVKESNAGMTDVTVLKLDLRESRHRAAPFSNSAAALKTDPLELQS